MTMLSASEARKQSLTNLVIAKGMTYDQLHCLYISLENRIAKRIAEGYPFVFVQVSSLFNEDEEPFANMTGLEPEEGEHESPAEKANQILAWACQAVLPEGYVVKDKDRSIPKRCPMVGIYWAPDVFCGHEPREEDD